jgi:hypothetical protein
MYCTLLFCYSTMFITDWRGAWHERTSTKSCDSKAKDRYMLTG